MCSQNAQIAKMRAIATSDTMRICWGGRYAILIPGIPLMENLLGRMLCCFSFPLFYRWKMSREGRCAVSHSHCSIGGKRVGEDAVQSSSPVLSL